MGESFHGRPLTDERNEFLEHTRQARQKRVADQKNLEAALVIQRFYRVNMAKRLARQKALERFLKLMIKFNPEENQLVKSKEVFIAANLLMKWWKEKVPQEALEKIARYVVWSMNQSNSSYSYIGCGMNKETAVSWIHHLKDLAMLCLQAMTKLKPELVSDSKLLSLYLTTLVSLTSLDKWTILQGSQYVSLVPGMRRLTASIYSRMKSGGVIFTSMHSVLIAGLARPGKFSLKKANLMAIAKMTNKCVKDDDNIDSEALVQFVYNILTVPAYTYYVQSMCPSDLEVPLLPLIAKIIVEDHTPVKSNLASCLSLLANIIELGQCSGSLTLNFYPTYSQAVTVLLNICAKYSECTKKSHWHPILGWVEHPIPSSVINSVAAIKSQIEFLWGPVFLDAIFCYLIEYLKGSPVPVNDKEDSPPISKGGLFKNSFVKMVRRAFMFESPQGGSIHTGPLRFNSDITLKVSKSCELYGTIISTFSICRLDVLTGLCFKQNSKWLVSLWRFVQQLSRDVKGWVEVLLAMPKQPQESLIVMFADAMVHFITMSDDQEMYEDQKAFTLSEVSKIAQFVNQLCYRSLTATNTTVKVRESTWSTLKTLLIVLYRRDCRRKYCPDDHWLIDSGRLGVLISDIEKGKKHAKKILLDMPHVMREESRVILFRKWAASEKQLTGNTPDEYGTPACPSTLVTIQRGRIVEDGYAQLSNLTPKALKGIIRVRFQNELGLDEAGIDQDGVFKEFLEETINAVFNPSLNLFKSTSENLLYPSPLSYLHDNHLQLFEFVGKMLAKAIYEGIVVDVHFATFFLSQILGYQQNALFSAIDELQSLDRELYNSLNYIKHYEGNVEELELTFSVDQDCLGEIKTKELTPGGRLIPVTNENKISYLYLMAHFHLYVQIKDQTAAFLKGFRAIIPNEWIRIFSPPELQRLISGEDMDIDLNDLRRNTQYYGGFHDNHRVIVWLWEILEQDFSEKERRQFLKFVTSCSKPPLLGFQNLDPPFSIRCVEVSDDEDTGDTIGSVLRGFLTIGKKSPVGRLPTSSTCFNLLKLPNYQKKATLREKLRYAVTSNVGFELS